MTTSIPTRRLTDYLHDYWQSKADGAAFPTFDSIDMKEIDRNFVNDCFLIQLVPTVTMNISKMVFLGKNLNTDFKKDESGVHIKNVIVRFLETPMDSYAKVIESKKPLIQNIDSRSNLVLRKLLWIEHHERK
jgi:hypothetical protein